ncbi:MAG: hypothetical protein OES09_07535, partial [Gammaproteobacteria bacterium]|nr:hypothetical protein [Gammaproteobacteria bacterium]
YPGIVAGDSGDREDIAQRHRKIRQHDLEHRLAGGFLYRRIGGRRCSGFGVTPFAQFTSEFPAHLQQQ